MIEVEVIKEFQDKNNKNKTRVVGEIFIATIERTNQLMYENVNQKAFVKIKSIKPIPKIANKNKGSE